MCPGSLCAVAPRPRPLASWVVKTRPNEADQPSWWEPWIIGEATKRWPPPDAASRTLQRRSSFAPSGVVVYDASVEEDSNRPKKSSDDLIREAKERFGAYDPTYEVTSSAPKAAQDRPEPPAPPAPRRPPVIPPFDPRPRRVDQSDLPPLTRREPDHVPTGPVSAPNKSIGPVGCLGILLLAVAAFFWIGALGAILDGDDDPGGIVGGTIILTIVPVIFGLRLLMRGLRRRRAS